MSPPALVLPPAVVDTRHEYRHVFGIYVPIAVGVFLVIVVITTGVVLRYRSRPPERAARWHENNRLEGTYALALALVCVFLLFVTFTAEHRVDTVANHQKPALTVEVTAAKWEWRFYYPSYGITVRSGTVGRQPLVVPTGEAVRFDLVSEDVIHSFWIPEVDYKHDLIPGSTQVTTLSFGRAGTFEGQCAEFCGLRHADMVFPVRAVSPARFLAWAAAGARAAP